MLEQQACCCISRDAFYPAASCVCTKQLLLVGVCEKDIPKKNVMLSSVNSQNNEINISTTVKKLSPER